MELAVFRDCENLIEEFAATPINKKDEAQAKNYKYFCQIWKSLNLHLLYAAQTWNVELLQTTNAAFYAATKMLCEGQRASDLRKRVPSREQTKSPPSTAPTTSTSNRRSEETQHVTLKQIGAFYLLYTLYFKQPTEQYVKITMTPRTWQQMQSFLKNDVPKEGVWLEELQYMLGELIRCNAFRYAAVSFPLGLEGLVNYERVHEEDDMQKFHVEGSEQDSAECFKQDMAIINTTQATVPALVALEEGYNEMKENLAKEDKLDIAAFPPTKIFKSIEDTFQNLTRILGDHGKNRPKKKNYNKNYNKKAGQDNKGREKRAARPTNTLRMELKRKAFEIVKGSHPIEEIEDEDSNNDILEEEDVAGPSRRGGRLSVRVLLEHGMTKEILNEIEGTSAVDEEDDEEEPEDDEEEPEVDEDEVEANEAIKSIVQIKQEKI